MNKWMLAFWSCFFLLIVSNLFLLYSIVDQGVTLTYSNISYEEQIRANEVLGNLIVRGGAEYSQKDMLFLLRQLYPEAFIVEQGNRITMHPNHFEFSDGKLSFVR